MIIALIQHISSSLVLIKSAFKLANSLGKEFGVACIAPTPDEFNKLRTVTEKLLSDNEIITANLFQISGLNSIHTFCEENEVSFLFMQLSDSKSSGIQKMLTACRELRIPYLFYKVTFSPLQTEKIVVPVNFLEEEIEKAQFASAFGRFCQSEIVILQANDYGSKATTTTARMLELFDKFNLNVRVEKARGDSFKVDKESVSKATELNAGLIIITASREYGLDDILFGPTELHVVKKSNIPVLLVNPRADLYALCD